MSSPAVTKSSHFTSSSQEDNRNLAGDSPTTPVAGPSSSENQTRLLPLSSSSAIANRPSAGTPAPWIPRLSVLARHPTRNKTENEWDAHPVHVGEFPEELCNAQASFLQKNVPSDKRISGGIDRGTSLSWIVYENQLFIWSYLSPAASKHCIVVEIPASISERRDISTHFNDGNPWMVCMIDWNCTFIKKYRKQSNSMGIILCNKKSQATIYWPDIYSESGNSPVVSLASYDGSESAFSPADKKTTLNSQRQRSRLGSSYSVEKGCFNSFIASAIPGIRHNCVALAAGSDGELWRFQCSPSGIGREKVLLDFNILSMETSDGGWDLIGKGYPRSLIWGYFEKSNRQFLLLTGHKIQCFNISLDLKHDISKIWSHEIIDTDNDLGVKKDLAGQKRIWPLDMQIDYSGKQLTVLVATICKDQVSSSSYTQYSLLSMQYKPWVSIYCEIIEPIQEWVIEKKAPLRVEAENFLFSMKLRVGGKPSGSTIILSGDGTATVSNYWRNSTRLYKFDLPWDAGKVLDASVFPSTEDDGEGAWVVVTEKAGVWVIPENAILRDGVEPPERSLSRKGSSNEGAAEEESISLAVGGAIAPRRESSEAWDARERQKAVFTGTTRRTAQDYKSPNLYQHVKDILDDKYHHPTEGVEESKEDDLRKLSAPLLSTARNHEGSEILRNICCDLNDSTLLQKLMNESLGPKRGYSYFVSEQLYENRQFAKLLNPGEEFQEQLTIFPKQHKDLFWLHEVLSSPTEEGADLDS